MERDFTYIDDVVNGVTKIIEGDLAEREHYKIYNIGNNKTESLEYFINTIEKAIGKNAVKVMCPMQDGDVPKTFSNIDKSIKYFKYSPTTNIKSGIKDFIKWYKTYKRL
jgi:UDP-glucuronate 4-epimerase